MFFVVVSIVRYALRLKSPRKVTGPDFIPLKFIKFASNVIDSHLYNIIIKELQRNTTQHKERRVRHVGALGAEARRCNLIIGNARRRAGGRYLEINN